MTLREFIVQLAAKEHMGTVRENAHENIVPISFNTIRIAWDADFAGQQVRQYAEFKSISI